VGPKLILVLLILIGWSLVLPLPLLAESGRPHGDAQGAMPANISVALTQNKYSDVDVKDAKTALIVWIDMITKKTGVPTKVELFSFDDLGMLEKEAKGNKVDLVFLFPQEYLYLKNRIPFEPIAVSIPLGTDHKYFAVLARKDRGINDLRRLANKDAILEAGENSPLISMWLETLLLKEGFLGPAAFFANFKNVKKASQALLPVFFKQADACAVSQGAFETMKELNPQVGQELVSLAHSPGFPQGVVCMRKGLAEKYGGFVEEMFSIHKRTQGKQILTLMKIKKLIPFSPANLETTEALVAENQTLKLKLAKRN
jgi:ABC-type phosphate/phosphonate transport system substrate-binding protein